MGQKKNENNYQGERKLLSTFGKKKIILKKCQQKHQLLLAAHYLKL